MKEMEIQAWRANRPLQFMVGSYAAIWLLLAVSPTERGEWLLENILVAAVLLVMGFTYKKFPFSNGSYFFLYLFLIFHTYGAHYTYQKTPVDDWLKSAFHTHRSYYDRIVHLLFGLLLAYPVREWFIRLSGLSRLWAILLPVTVLTTFSSFFEIIEMWVALLGSTLGQDYVGLQGDIWDSVKDIEMGLIGSVAASVAYSFLADASRFIRMRQAR